VTVVESELLSLAADRANLTCEEVLSTLLLPDWGNASRMYDWRNHERVEVQGMWPKLRQESRLTALLQATIEAYDEEGWDSVWSS
jgi:hypothetical protein